MEFFDYKLITRLVKLKLHNKMDDVSNTKTCYISELDSYVNFERNFELT
jgi:hypothetical protein